MIGTTKDIQGLYDLENAGGSNMELETDRIYCGDCVELMKHIAPNSIDLVVTSPPYDNLRNYNGFSFTFEKIATELFRVLKEQGVIVWVVGDKIDNGNKSLSSFRQAIYFQDHGFKVHDIMIYEKKNTPFMRSNAYTNCYELMIVLSKNGPRTFNPIMVNTKREGYEMLITNKKADGINKKVLGKLNETKVKNNIWQYAVGLGGTTKDKIAFTHPAVFPEKLAQDHILSWTNEGDIVLDPMCGSGTTCKMAMINNRRFIGIDISEEYCEIARKRLSTASRRMGKLL
jgi:site-specific DNA-methyltransferase (adenine-specific)